MAEQLAQRLRVASAGFQFLDADVELDVGPDRGKRFRQVHRVHVIAETLTTLALDLFAMRDDACRAVVLIEPLGGCLGSYLGYAGYVIRAVPNQRKVVDDLFRPDVKLGLDRIAIHARVVHRVYERYLIRNQLREILIASRNEHPQTLLFRLGAECAYHVVGFDALNAQQGQAHCLDGVEDWLHLGPQFVGHRRSRRLVFGIDIVAKRLAGRVENDGYTFRLLFAYELADHRQHTVQCPRRLSL